MPYLNSYNGLTLPAFGKVDFLKHHGATEIQEPIVWQENLVCVAENANFDAAAHAYDEREMARFKRPDDRKKTWLIVPNASIFSK